MSKRIGSDSLGDRLKELEMAEAGRAMMPDLPVIARLARSFGLRSSPWNRWFRSQFASLAASRPSSTSSELTRRIRLGLDF